MNKNCVLALANKYSVDVDSALFYLLDVGINVSKPLDIVPRKKLRFAHQALSLKRGIFDQLCIETLAKKSNKSEKEIRTTLRGLNFIQKFGQKRIPKRYKSKVYALLFPKEKIDTKVSLPPIALAQSTLIPEPVKKKEIKWRQVGKVEPIRHISINEVLFIHTELVKDFLRTSNPIAVANPRKGLLEMAVNRPHASFGGNFKYQTVLMCGATLLYGLVLNHAFIDGNKRTAFVSLLTFLDRNERLLIVNEKEMENFLLTLAGRNLRDKKGNRLGSMDEELIYIAYWLSDRIRLLERSDYHLKSHDLMNILKNFGCEVISKRGNTAKVKLGKNQTMIPYHDEGHEVDMLDIKRIRKDLKLDEKNGIDSFIFYNKAPRITGFILKYRKLLNRLAYF